jgi:hypothetical protein
MSQYPLRSRLTKRGTTKEDDTNPPPSSVSSVASRSHTPFGRGGLTPDPRTASRGGIGDNSTAGRGGGGDMLHATSRRERGVNITRFSRLQPREKEKSEDDVLETIPAPENKPDEDETVPTEEAIEKIPPTTEFDVFQAFRLPFAQSQPEEECEFQPLDDGFDQTESLQSEDPKIPSKLILMDGSARLTVHNTPEYETFSSRLQNKPVDITGITGIQFVLQKFAFIPSPSELLLFQSLDVEDVLSLLDICSLDPRPLYERMRTNPHILDEHQNDLGAAFDSRSVYFYSILSGLFAYLRDSYGLPTDSQGYFSGTFNLDHLPAGTDATAYLESRGPDLESELR